MAYLLIAGLAGLLGWALWFTNRDADRGPMLLIGVVAVIVAISGVFIYRGLQPPPPPKVPPQWNLALGEMMARQVSKLVPSGGRVLLFIIPESMARNQIDLRSVREEHLQAIQRGLAKNLIVTVIDTSPAIPSLSGGFLTSAALRESLAVYPDTKAIISLLPPAEPLPEMTGNPKIVVFASSLESVRDDLETGRLAAAVVVRSDAANLWQTPKGEIEQIFAARFRLLTAGNLPPPR